MIFALGTHRSSQDWFDAGVPLFLSRRQMPRVRLPEARAPWMLDSGGFTELSTYGEWRTTEDEYVAEVLRLRAVGNLAWVAPQDWMCEPEIIAGGDRYPGTGLDVREHQARTVDNFVRLRQRLGPLVIPVLQGWTLDEYLACWQMYEDAGVALEHERVVGVGSVCRRQDTVEAARLFRRLHADGLVLHGFGVKVTGLLTYGECLASADSMAWSFDARLSSPLPGCEHKACNNCLRYALRWRSELLARLGQLALDVA